MGSLSSYQLLWFLASITSTRDSNPDLPAPHPVALPLGHRVGYSHWKWNNYLNICPARFFLFSSRFLTCRALKSCRIVQYNKYILLLQFSIRSRDCRHHVLYLFAFKWNRVWNKKWKIDYFCFFHVHFYIYEKKRCFKIFIYSYIHNKFKYFF